MNKELERNSAGVRVSDGTMLNLWTGERGRPSLAFLYENPDKHRMYHNYDSETHIYRDFAGECLHRGLALHEIHGVGVLSVKYRDEDGKLRRDLPFGDKALDHVDIEINKPCHINNVIFNRASDVDSLSFADAQLLRNGKHFVIVTNDAIYTDEWYPMIEAYKALAENMKIEHVMDAFTNKSHFTGSDGPVSVEELAAKAIRENKECVIAPILQLQKRVDGQWVNILPEDVMPGMDIRTSGLASPLLDVSAVEYREGQLTIVTPDAIFCSNPALGTALKDLKDNIQMVVERWDPQEEWSDVLISHSCRMETLAAEWLENNRELPEELITERFEPDDLQRDEEYLGPCYDS